VVGQAPRLLVVQLELDPGNVLADLSEDFTAQPIMLLVLIVNAVGIGVFPVIGNRETPSALAQSKVGSDAHCEHAREPERGDSRQALLEQDGIGGPLGGIFGRPQAADHDVADHQHSPGRTGATRHSQALVLMRGVSHSVAARPRKRTDGRDSIGGRVTCGLHDAGGFR
jgi:hypothetical protein